MKSIQSKIIFRGIFLISSKILLQNPGIFFKMKVFISKEIFRGIQNILY